MSRAPIALTGYFYPRASEADDPPISNWQNVRQKYEGLPNSGRIFDSGDIVVYDIRRAARAGGAPSRCLNTGFKLGSASTVGLRAQ